MRKRLESLVAEMEPQAQKAFFESIADLRAGADLKALVEALEARDIDAAIRALNLEPSALRPFSRAIEQAYEGGGGITAEAVSDLFSRQGAKTVIRFDLTNPRAQAQISEFGLQKVAADVLPDMRQSARTIIEAGYLQGRGPKDIGRDLVGRVNRVTGRLEGGTVGLTNNQTEYVLSMRQRLASGDPAKMRKVLAMKRRDKRFDRTIAKYIKEGKPVPQDMIDRMAGRYADRLTQLRGEMLARTEVGQAVHRAKHESFKQGLEKTGYTEQAVTRRWRHSGLHGEDSRPQHIAMNNVTVKGMTQPFVMPDGTRMMHPLDMSLGAGANHIVGCRCDEEIDIDFSEGLD
ncbi:head morphogenesis protein [Consotaella aegiceratis]|uniref:head morphogenesis protein n=1 Tax=Consotaella aegiceratis TaxID=3097961 RepID=UPI002F41FA86